MSLLERVVSALDRYPSVRYLKEGNSIEVEAASPDGFDVRITSEGPSSVVHYEGWHEDFENDEHALNCFLLGLSSAIRMRIARRGTCDYKWTAEVLEKGRWETVSTVVLLLFPFWRRKVETIRRNRFIEDPRPVLT